MTSSNRNSRKVRTRTFVSVVLFALILGGFSYLYLKISEQSAMYGEVKANLDRYNADVSIKQTEFENVSRRLGEKVADLSSTNWEWLDANAALQLVQADLAAQVRKLENAKQELQKTEERNSALRIKNEEYGSLTVQVDEKSKKLEDLNSKIMTLNSKLDNLKSDVSAKTVEVSRKDEEILSQRSEISELSERIGALEADRKNKIQQLNDFKSEFSQAEQRASDVEQRLSTAQAGLDETLPKLEAAKSDLEQEKQRLASVKEQISKKTSEANDLDTEIDNLKSQAE